MEPHSLKLQSLLEELAQLLELEPATPSDKELLTSWKITPDHEVFFGTSDRGLTLFCVIGTPPVRNKEDFFLLTMRANFIGQGTGGHVIGMDKEEKFLTLSSIIPYDVNVKRFKEVVEDFVNFVTYWRGELSKYIEQGSSPFG